MSAPPAGPRTPSWKPEFYPPGIGAKEFLRFYAEPLPTVELNTDRLPASRRGAVRPAGRSRRRPGSRFAPKLAGQPASRMLADCSASRRVGRTRRDRLGPVIRVQLISAPSDERDDRADPRLARSGPPPRVRSRASVVGRDRTSPGRGGSGARQRSRARCAVSPTSGFRDPPYDDEALRGRCASAGDVRSTDA